MTRREHEAVAIRATQGARVVPQRMPVEHRADLGAAERQAEVTALARMDGVDGEAPGDGGGAGENFFGSVLIGREAITNPRPPQTR